MNTSKYRMWINTRKSNVHWHQTQAKSSSLSKSGAGGTYTELELGPGCSSISRGRTAFKKSSNPCRRLVRLCPLSERHKGQVFALPSSPPFDTYFTTNDVFATASGYHWRLNWRGMAELTLESIDKLRIQPCRKLSVFGESAHCLHFPVLVLH